MEILATLDLCRRRADVRARTAISTYRDTRARVQSGLHCDCCVHRSSPVGRHLEAVACRIERTSDDGVIQGSRVTDSMVFAEPPEGRPVRE